MSTARPDNLTVPIIVYGGNGDMKKNIKRLIALILTVMMVLSTNGFTVLAETVSEVESEVVGAAGDEEEAYSEEAYEEEAPEADLYAVAASEEDAQA